MHTIHGLGSVLTEAADRYLPQALTDVSLRTSLSEKAPMVTSADILDIINGRERPKKPPNAGTKLLYALKPTFIINSPLVGEKVIAPYGEAKAGESESTKRKILISASLVALGFIGLGFAIGRVRG
jgi:hypothetical protein